MNFNSLGKNRSLVRKIGRRVAKQRPTSPMGSPAQNAPAAPQQPQQAQSQPAQQQAPKPAEQPKPVEAQPAQQPQQAQPQQPTQQSQPQAATPAQQPQQNVFERRASGANPISNVINFASQNRGTAQQQSQMQAQQQQAQFLQQQQQAAQQPQQVNRQPQMSSQQMPKPAMQRNYFPNLQQRMGGQPQQQMQPSSQVEQEEMPQQEMPQEEMQQDEQMIQGGMPQMPKPTSFQQLQGLSGQAGALAGMGSQLAKFAGASGIASKLGGAAGGLGAAAQGLGAFGSLAGGDKVGGVDQLAGMAANFIPGVGPAAGLAYNMIPEGMRRQLIGQGLNVAGKMGLDANALNVNKPGKMAEGLAKTGLNVATGGKVGKEVLKSVSKNVAKPAAKAVKSVGKALKKVCHLVGTQIRMADGSIKNIENLKLGDQLALGGTLLSKGESFQTEALYNYNDVFVTGSHAVFENGNWLRVEESGLAYPVESEGLLYPLVTENNLIVTADGQVWADMNEVDDTYNLTDDDIIDKLNTDYERNKFLQEYMNDISPIISATRVRFA